MIYYANPSGGPIRAAMDSGEVGCILTPRQGSRYNPAWELMADNGCFSSRWDHDTWYRWLGQQARTVRFAVAPDVVDLTGTPTHQATLERWRTYKPIITDLGFTPAFVCGVGATPNTVPDDAPVLFLGGTTAWKLGHIATDITRNAKAEGRWVHMGRVNSERRLTAARSMGCDSVDGTYLTFGPEINLGRLRAWLQRAADQPMLPFA